MVKVENEEAQKQRAGGALPLDLQCSCPTPYLYHFLIVMDFQSCDLNAVSPPKFRGNLISNTAIIRGENSRR